MGKPLPNVSHILGVCSGKGGVGKSTVAVNLAVALSQSGKRVGLLDADIYGPSVPSLMRLSGLPTLSPESRKMIPLENYGVRVMSMGFVAPDAPAVWRGPMASSALSQLISGTEWGRLDVLVVDLPPGTGDVHLTLAQTLSLSGCVVVSTPHDMALVSAVKGLRMFQKVGVPILGVIENMAFYECDGCGTRKYLFGEKKARAKAEELGVPFLGEIPIVASDVPVAVAAPQGPVGAVYGAMAGLLWERLVEAQNTAATTIIRD